MLRRKGGSEVVENIRTHWSPHVRTDGTRPPFQKCGEIPSIESRQQCGLMIPAKECYWSLFRQFD